MPLLTQIKRLLVGRPIATKHAHHERLPKIFGLPVFASDALSSVAYASEEMIRQLVVAGTFALGLTFTTSLSIACLLVIVAISYFQTIHAYPQGGGSYRVTTENLGSKAGRVAGASLLIDYVLTVAVSISAGILAIKSIAGLNVKPEHEGTVLVVLGVLAVLVVGILNLRGAKESGALFAVPTYGFVLLIASLIVSGFYRILVMGEPPVAPVIPEGWSMSQPWGELSQFAMLALLFRTFAAGCTALTGVEAIADGVQAFRPPEARNASITLVTMACILITMFLGISWLAQYFGIVPLAEISDPAYKTVVASMAERIWGPGVLFWVLQIATAAILILAANTAFADFPRLSSFIARDGFLPRQLTSQGDRLVFQNGIILLCVLAIGLIVAFRGDTHALIPLYAVGVFTSFTLSQAGMVVRLNRLKQRFRMLISLIGCITTGLVTIIILETKFAEGAWLITVAIAILLVTFALIRKHYDYLAGELSITGDEVAPPVRTTVLLLVPRVHRGILKAIAYARSMTSDCRALHVTLEPGKTEYIKREWAKYAPDIPLVILESPYRSLIEPVTDYIDQVAEEDPDLMVTVIVPQAVPKRWYQALLHSNIAVYLKMALASRKNVVITNVRYFLR